MKQSKKIHNFIDLVFMMLPFILLALSVFRDGAFDFVVFENSISELRNFDFGLSEFILTNMFNNTTNVYILFLFDIMTYYMIWKILDLMFYCLSFLIDWSRSLIDRLGGR